MRKQLNVNLDFACIALIGITTLCTLFLYFFTEARWDILKQRFTDLQLMELLPEPPKSDIDEWSLLIEAIIWVESRGNDNAVGRHNDAGCLQITPVYIAEANSIIGRKGYYKLDDRFNRQKSIEIFSVVNAYHNIERCHERAISLHNPRADSSYRNRIMQKLEELKKQ